MKAEEKIKAISRHVASVYRRFDRAFKNYPKDILDLIVFHKFHFFMPEDDALQAYRRLKTSFVDWNEVRISSVKEIQEIFDGVPDALEIAIFVKDFLEFLHRENQSVSLEFLTQKTLAEIRRYLKQVKGIEPATISLVLLLRKEHPVFPLSAPMERSLVRVGVLRRGDTRDHKERFLHGLLDVEQALPFHHFFLQHSREVCPPEEEKLQCPSCRIRAACSFFRRRSRRLNGRLNHAAALKKGKS